MQVLAAALQTSQTGHQDLSPAAKSQATALLACSIYKHFNL